MEQEKYYWIVKMEGDTRVIEADDLDDLLRKALFMRWCPTCGFSSKYEPRDDVKRLSDAAKQLRRERDEARTKYLQITSSQSQFFRQSVGKGTEPWPERFTQATLSWHCKTCERPMSRTLKAAELKGPEAPKPSPEECDICRLESLQKEHHAELIRAMQGFCRFATAFANGGVLFDAYWHAKEEAPDGK